MSSARNGGRPSGRAAMIEAAERVARRDGPGAVTVDAVIREAGVSRGGLMYHFPSKLDLIRALVEQDVTHLRSALFSSDDSAGNAPPTTPSERLRVYLDACAPEPGERDYAALIAALAEDPDTAASWVALQRELDRLDTDQSEPGDVRTIMARLALDGLWLSNLIDPDRFTPEQMERIVATIWPGSAASSASALKRASATSPASALKRASATSPASALKRASAVPSASALKRASAVSPADGAEAP